MGSELIIYDAPAPLGPFTLVHFEDPWESRDEPYIRALLKWFDRDRLEGWLLFSGLLAQRRRHTLLPRAHPALPPLLR